MQWRFTVLLAVLIAGAGAPLAAAQGHDQHGGGEAQDGPAEDDDSGFSGDPVEVIMYHHVYSLLDKVPMNTQPMDAAAPDLNRGYGTPTTVTPAYSSGASFNEMYMYNSPGPVHYNVSLSAPRYHPERGLAEDLRLDASKEIMVYWYLGVEASQGPGFRSPQPVGGSIEGVTVRATLRLGDDVGADLDAGQIIAEGEWVGTLESAPGGAPTEVVINLGTPKVPVIPLDESFNLKVEWFQVKDSNSEYMSKDWVMRTGENYPNRMVWTIQNPIRVNYLHPQFIGDRKLAIHAAFNSPFGNYDVDLDPSNPQKLSEALKFIGPDGKEFTPKELQGPIIVQKAWVHNHHFEPVLATWVWNYREEGADPGDYQVALDVSNLQGNAGASKEGLFTILSGGRAGEAISSAGTVVAPQALEDAAADAPLPPMIVPVALLAAGLVVARRRR